MAEDLMFAVVEVLIFIGGILVGYSYGKGWMKNGFQDKKVLKARKE